MAMAAVGSHLMAKKKKYTYLYIYKKKLAKQASNLQSRCSRSKRCGLVSRLPWLVPTVYLAANGFLIILRGGRFQSNSDFANVRRGAT